MSLFGSEDDNKNELVKATQTPTVAALAADYNILVRDKPWENDDIDNEQVSTPFTMRVYCSFFPYSYDVTSDVNLATIIGAHVLAKVKEADGSFDPDKFNLGFHPGVLETLSTFVTSVLLLQYGFTDTTKQALSLFGRNQPELRTRRRISKLRSLYKGQVARCPGHANNLGHVVCSNNGCTKEVTDKCYMTSLVPTCKLKVQPGKSY